MQLHWPIFEFLNPNQTDFFIRFNLENNFSLRIFRASGKFWADFLPLKTLHPQKVVIFRTDFFFVWFVCNIINRLIAAKWGFPPLPCFRACLLLILWGEMGCNLMIASINFIWDEFNVICVKGRLILTKRNGFYFNDFHLIESNYLKKK